MVEKFKFQLCELMMQMVILDFFPTNLVFCNLDFLLGFTVQFHNSFAD